VATCIHGFEPGQCLICQTLSPSQEESGGRRHNRRTAKAEARSHQDRLPAGAVEVVDSDDRPRGSRAASHILIAVVLVILAVIAFWVVAGVVFAVLRLVEILAVAIVAGVLGYRLGRVRGRQDH
jgi:Flp pilus assembly protein TadB